MVQIGLGIFQPVHLVHLAHNDKLVPVRSDRAIVIEAVCQLRIAADHVIRFDDGSGDRVVNATTLTGGLGSRRVHDFLLCVIHHALALGNTLGNHRTRQDCSIGVVEFDPVIVFNSDLSCVDFADPHDRTAAIEREHQQIFRAGAVNAPFVMRRDPIEDYLFASFGVLVDDGSRGFCIHRWLVNAHGFSEVPHPFMILVELLAAGKGAPGNQFVNIGIAGVVADMLVFQTAPRR